MITVKGETAAGIFVIFAILSFAFMALFSDAVRIVTYIISLPLALTTLDCFRKIQMREDGCLMQIFFWKKFYPWSAFQTVRLLDFKKCTVRSRNGGYYAEGVLFYTRRIKSFPFTWDPETYLFYRDPLCRHSFYVQFPPKESYEKKELGQPIAVNYSYRVKREEFMARAEEWGLKIEGWNVPMPASQIEKRRRW